MGIGSPSGPTVGSPIRVARGATRTLAMLSGARGAAGGGGACGGAAATGAGAGGRAGAADGAALAAGRTAWVDGGVICTAGTVTAGCEIGLAARGGAAGGS